ncbi:MAG: YhbY family RNA-binding protein [Candidatus Saliniplasma sp.]
MERKKARIRGQDLEPIVRVGKKGIDENMVLEIERHLEDKDLIKIKILRNNPIQDTDEIVDILEEKTSGKVIETRGRTVLLAAEEELTV